LPQSGAVIAAKYFAMCRGENKRWARAKFHENNAGFCNLFCIVFGGHGWKNRLQNDVLTLL
jgi:hypothetical protein